MNISIILFILILTALFVIYAHREGKRHGTRVSEELAGVCKSAFLETESKKEARKQKVLDLFRQKSDLSNHEIRQVLGVSSRTAVRYMDELESDGLVEQVGRIGHAVIYRLK